MQKAYTLWELNNLVRLTIEGNLIGGYWVEAELSECRENRGHCYMELIEKEEGSNTPIARARAVCWRNVWAVLRSSFERVTGQSLHVGMKVMLQVSPQFHEAFGFSWIVDDINPEFTLGDMARRRQEIISQLKAEGVFDLQRELALPVFAQRIAVISSASAAGYGDFCKQLSDNDSGLVFYTKLFPAIMQGEAVEQSIIQALNQINDQADCFDVVVIIRGGGATADMSGFDTLQLAENVANFPLPIITGIGHERDESVLDMVSYRRVKTPTAAAAFLVSHLTDVMTALTDAEKQLRLFASHRMEVEHMRLERLAGKVPVLFSLMRERQEARLDTLFTRLLQRCRQHLDAQNYQLGQLSARLKPAIEGRLTRQDYRMQMLEQRVKALDPTVLLQRGYSITLHNGHAVRKASQLRAGDTIVTRLAEGEVKSTVNNK